MTTPQLRIARHPFRFLMTAALLWVALMGTANAQPPEVPLFQRAQLAMERIREDKLTPEQALEDGVMYQDILLYALGDAQMLDPGHGLWNPAQESYGYAQLLVDKLPKLLEKPSPLSDNARIRVAMFFSSKNDPRAIPLMEEIIAGLPRENANIETVVAALSHLSGVYHSAGQPTKAIETSLKIKEFTKEPSHVANSLLGAARASYSMGDKEGAAKLYDEIVGYGYGWATGHAYYDLSSHLFAAGKLEEGRALLKKPIAGHLADQARVVLNHQLAQSYLKTGEREEARRYAQATIDQYKSLANPLKNHGMEQFVSGAEQVLLQLDKTNEAKEPVAPQK